MQICMKKKYISFSSSLSILLQAMVCAHSAAFAQAQYNLLHWQERKNKNMKKDKHCQEQQQEVAVRVAHFFLSLLVASPMSNCRRFRKPSFVGWHFPFIFVQSRSIFSGLIVGILLSCLFGSSAIPSVANGVPLSLGSLILSFSCAF